MDKNFLLKKAIQSVLAQHKSDVEKAEEIIEIIESDKTVYVVYHRDLDQWFLDDVYLNEEDAKAYVDKRNPLVIHDYKYSYTERKLR